MEKHAKVAKNINILKYLPKAASAVNFHNPPFSPSRDRRAEYLQKVKLHAHGKGFSGPIITMIPDEIRKKPKKGSGFESQEDQEPTSPKISCMGQIKQKKKMCKANRVSRQETKPAAVSTPREGAKKHSKNFKRFFSFKQHRKSDASSEDGGVRVRPSFADQRATSLSQMKRFASGRDHGLANFDWTAQITPTDQRECYSDEERRYSDEEEDEDVKIPFSAPLAIGGEVALRPRTEINLWKRRTMNRPRRLQLN